MSEIKTKKNQSSVHDFLAGITPDKKRNDGFELLDIFSEVTAETPMMWGTSIVGFGQYHYKSERSSQEGDWPLVAFSPRKASLSLYLSAGQGLNQALLDKLGKHKMGKGCLYINKLDDIDRPVLRQLIKESFESMREINR